MFKNPFAPLFDSPFPQAYSPVIPPVENLISPLGTIDVVWDKVYKWKGTPGSQYEGIEIRTSDGVTLIHEENLWAVDYWRGSYYSAAFGNIPNGEYAWRTRSYTTQWSEWTAWGYFTLTKELQPTRPSGTYTSWDKLFRWQGLAVAESYYMSVYTADDTALINNWYDVSVTGGAGATDCSLLVDRFFVNGDYKWRIGSWSFGAITYSEWVYFTMNTTQMMATPVSPIGSYTNWDTNFTITDAPVGTEYWYLEVAEKGGAVLYGGWLRIGDQNPNSPIPTRNLPYGEYKWRVLTWGTSYGYGNYTAWQDFFLGTVLKEPEGNLPIDSWDGFCYWTGLPSMTWYSLEIYNADTGVAVFAVWYTAGQVGQTLENFECKSVDSKLDLPPNKNYKWRIMQYDGNSYLYTPYHYFTNNRTTTTVAILGEPSGTLTETFDGVFTWTGVTYPNSATWYLIQLESFVDNAWVAYYSAWLTGEQTGGYGAGACSFDLVPPASFPNGIYRWTIQDYGGYGYGSYAPYKEFTIDVPT